jgi:hypothetical protein
LNKNIKISVSPGELVDKITILEIKASSIKDSAKIPAVVRELSALLKVYYGLVEKHDSKKAQINKLKLKLSAINKNLWKIEDKIRKHEAEKMFNTAFVVLSRAIYLNNDKRAELKNKINILLESDIKEIKEYYKYNK